ncbi:MAG: plasmid pRiA4b ORF-3 family protein [Oscillospiraceae bacterium]|nr:plasmid pRiA4b ORF-3 family protein [Oscillospiraceae bacterium]
MVTKVYTFHITYEGMEEKIWRKVEVSSNYRLDQLGYMVLAAFDTLAYHLFEFYYDDDRFEIPNEDAPFEQIDMANFKLHQLDLKLGDRIRMDYDFGTTQTFWLELIEIADMKRGWGRRYPYVLDGAGRGIIDDMSCEELSELVAQIDRNGKTDEPIYYQERRMPWDYRWFDRDCMNSLLKGEIELIEEGYVPFWQQ